MTTEASSFSRALAAIADAHRADPRSEGPAAELLYAERLWAWLTRLVREPSPALQLAARAQHLERWAIPRSSYPMDRVGYLRWRRAVHLRQGERVEALLLAAGLSSELASRVRLLVSKSAPAKDAEGQALEDAACLVFLAHEFEPFAALHPDYTAQRVIGIIRKTWAKMSDQGHALALTIELPPPLAALVQAALAEDGARPPADDE